MEAAIICINILFKNSSITLPLHFKAFKKADEEQKAINHAKNDYDNAEFKVGTNSYVIEDNYGTVAELDISSISGVVLIDLAKEMDRQGELQILQARASEKAQAAYKSGSKILQPAPAGLVRQ